MVVGVVSQLSKEVNSSFFDCVQLERNAFIQALCHFTLLTFGSASGPLQDSRGQREASLPLNEMRAKHVEALKILIQLANTDGNYLGSNWFDVRI